MSYNITAWKTQKLRHFHVPISVFQNTGVDIHVMPRANFTKPYPVELTSEYYECFSAKGVMDEGVITLELLEISGEGSGRFLDLMKGVFAFSDGYLEAKIIWEGGDRLSKLEVLNGVITDTEFEF